MRSIKNAQLSNCTEQALCRESYPALPKGVCTKNGRQINQPSTSRQRWLNHPYPIDACVYTVKVCSHGTIATRIFLFEIMGCLGFVFSVYTWSDCNNNITIGREWVLYPFKVQSHWNICDFDLFLFLMGFVRGGVVTAVATCKHFH